eukprot:TRINITY_DN5572_c0_g1_i1.p1 TRINITY_DN5572_c0_g1~~TRINITY_DN5572_c0_g1_i1.p1  ORF type:complete len:281 (+),score=8.95 TRINITY_DN5572_c0_g1_i1:13-855(+)
MAHQLTLVVYWPRVRIHNFAQDSGPSSYHLVGWLHRPEDGTQLVVLCVCGIVRAEDPKQINTTIKNAVCAGRPHISRYCGGSPQFIGTVCSSEDSDDTEQVVGNDVWIKVCVTQPEGTVETTTVPRLQAYRSHATQLLIGTSLPPCQFVFYTPPIADTGYYSLDEDTATPTGNCATFLPDHPAEVNNTMDRVLRQINCTPIFNECLSEIDPAEETQNTRPSRPRTTTWQAILRAVVSLWMYLLLACDGAIQISLRCLESSIPLPVVSSVYKIKQLSAVVC